MPRENQYEAREREYSAGRNSDSGSQGTHQDMDRGIRTPHGKKQMAPLRSLFLKRTAHRWDAPAIFGPSTVTKPMTGRTAIPEKTVIFSRHRPGSEVVSGGRAGPPGACGAGFKHRSHCGRFQR